MKSDIAIVGGGMVGASLAVALSRLGLTLTLIEAIPHDAAAQPSFDERTTAISNGSRRILETLGLWRALASRASPIAKIHVSDMGRFGFARIDAKEQNLEALGFVVANRDLGSVLWNSLASLPGCTLRSPAKVVKVEQQDAEVLLEVESNGQIEQIEAKLVVAADGAQSAVRSAFGVDMHSRDYGQTALITTILPQRFHEHVAYERFTPHGPLALLPLADGRCTLVLTLKNDAVEGVLALSDEEFLKEVQKRFGFRLGRFLKVGRRVAYPLSLTRAERLSQGRCVIIGNAAQALHPVAGMGFNLGLRDAACLAEVLATRVKPGRLDPGERDALAEYDGWRHGDRRGIIAFTDGLVRTFSSPLKSVALLRDLSLLAFDLLPPAKAALSRLSTGAARRIPKLARGVPL
jgi:2-octaprenyl-6-methoxyphenol hydroxylase